MMVRPKRSRARLKTVPEEDPGSTIKGRRSNETTELASGSSRIIFHTSDSNEETPTDVQPARPAKYRPRKKKVLESYV